MRAGKAEKRAFSPFPGRFEREGGSRPSGSVPKDLSEGGTGLGIVDRFVKTVFKPFLRTLFSEKNGLFLDLTVVSVPERFWFFSF